MERIDVLEEKLNDLSATAQELEHDINATAGAPGTDPIELRKKQQGLHAQRAEMTSVQSELRSLRQKLDEIERGRQKAE